jgi:hypothetical protein
MLDLGHNYLRIGEKALAFVAHDPRKMIDMTVGKDDCVNVVGLDTGGREVVRQPA